MKRKCEECGEMKDEHEMDMRNDRWLCNECDNMFMKLSGEKENEDDKKIRALQKWREGK